MVNADPIFVCDPYGMFILSAIHRHAIIMAVIAGTRVPRDGVRYREDCVLCTRLNRIE